MTSFSPSLDIVFSSLDKATPAGQQGHTHTWCFFNLAAVLGFNKATTATQQGHIRHSTRPHPPLNKAIPLFSSGTASGIPAWVPEKRVPPEAHLKQYGQKQPKNGPPACLQEHRPFAHPQATSPSRRNHARLLPTNAGRGAAWR